VVAAALSPATQGESNGPSVGSGSGSGSGATAEIHDILIGLPGRVIIATCRDAKLGPKRVGNGIEGAFAVTTPTRRRWQTD